MSRRKSTGDQEFGSDSFLDIIANIVGILIILIVVAGMKVARQPAEAAPHAVAAKADAVAAFVPSDSNAASETVVDRTEIRRLQDEIAKLQAQLSVSESGALTTEAQLQQLMDKLHQFRDANSLLLDDGISVDEERIRLQDSITALQAGFARTDQQSLAVRATILTLTDRQRDVVESLKDVATETQQLRETLEVAAEQQPTEDRILHRLSPVSRTRSDEEIHFRLQAGRIAHVPIEALLQRVKEQVIARRAIVMKFHRFDGVAGPVGGFMMKYTVERQTATPMEALQYGNSPYRLSYAHWEIVPAETFSAESVEQALRIGSRFRQILESTPTDTTVTVWLYPGDFQSFAAIRELAHGLNLRVAARPLPDGESIAGSPNGSASASQ